MTPEEQGTALRGSMTDETAQRIAALLSLVPPGAMPPGTPADGSDGAVS